MELGARQVTATSQNAPASHVGTGSAQSNDEQHKRHVNIHNDDDDDDDDDDDET